MEALFDFDIQTWPCFNSRAINKLPNCRVSLLAVIGSLRSLTHTKMPTHTYMELLLPFEFLSTHHNISKYSIPWTWLVKPIDMSPRCCLIKFSSVYTPNAHSCSCHRQIYSGIYNKEIRRQLKKNIYTWEMQTSSWGSVSQKLPLTSLARQKFEASCQLPLAWITRSRK